MESNAALNRQEATLEKPDKVPKKGFCLNPVMMDKRDLLNRDYNEKESTDNTPRRSNAPNVNQMPNIIPINPNNPSNQQNPDVPHKIFSSFSDLYNNPDVPSKDRFLFLFKLDWLANQFLCGCSLRIGVQIISIVFLAASMSKFFNVFPHDNLRKTVTAAIIFLIYFIAGYCFIYSSIYYNEQYAYSGLVIYTLIFYYIVLDNLLYIFFISFGILNPSGALKCLMDVVLLTIGLGILLLFHLYFIWVCYSYWIHLKHRNYELIKGNFYRTYQEYDTLNARNVN